MVPKYSVYRWMRSSTPSFFYLPSECSSSRSSFENHLGLIRAATQLRRVMQYHSQLGGVGNHWIVGSLAVHADTLTVLGIVLAVSIAVQRLPISRSVCGFSTDLTTSQGLPQGWSPLIAAIFTGILACNWLGALVPWPLLELPSGSELSAPTNDFNTTTALACMVSHATFFTGLVEFWLTIPVEGSWLDECQVTTPRWWRCPRLVSSQPWLERI